MPIDHSKCDHPSTKKDRSACRKAQGAGKVHTSAGEAPAKPKKAAKVLTWGEANAIGQVDHETLDDRIRESKKRPKASPVKVTKIP